MLNRVTDSCSQAPFLNKWKNMNFIRRQCLLLSKVFLFHLLKIPLKKKTTYTSNLQSHSVSLCFVFAVLVQTIKPWPLHLRRFAFPCMWLFSPALSSHIPAKNTCRVFQMEFCIFDLIHKALPDLVFSPPKSLFLS